MSTPAKLMVPAGMTSSGCGSEALGWVVGTGACAPRGRRMPGKGVGEPGTAGAGPVAGADGAGFAALAGGPPRFGGGAAGLTGDTLSAFVAAAGAAFVPPARRRGNLPPGVAGGF